MSIRASRFVTTRFGTFRVTVHQHFWGKSYVALTYGDVSMPAEILVRPQSACILGTTFHGTSCDCGRQLDEAMEAIVRNGRGIILYSLDEEGKGNGLIKKLRAHPTERLKDKRNYAGAVRALREVAKKEGMFKSFQLLTDNKAKRAAFARLWKEGFLVHFSS